jgi:RND family efflux transporter MFP subunit
MNKKIFVFILIPVLILGYFGYIKFFKKDNETLYTLAKVEKNTISVSVSGSGQIETEDKIDIKPKVSGEISQILVEEGDEVKANQLIFKIDDTDYKKALTDAQTALKTAQLALDKLLEPPDDYTLTQAENALLQAKENEKNIQKKLDQAYDDAFNTLNNVFLGLPSIMSGLHDLLFGFNFNSYQPNISYYSDTIKNYDSTAELLKDTTFNYYQNAKELYDQNYSDYKTINRFSDKETIEKLVNETYKTTKAIADVLKSANNLVQLYKDTMKEQKLTFSPLVDTHLTTLNNYLAQVNNYLSILFSVQQGIDSAKDSLATAQRTITEKEKYLEKLKKGPDELDIETQKLLVEQREESLKIAKENLEKCSIYAPFGGIISNINVKKGDSVSPATVLATLITKEKIAKISLNEVDAAKVKIGQKAIITFDALSDLTLTGKVAQIDTVGTVSQGVVSYNVKIVLDSDSPEIKPGMSVTANIIVDTKIDVLSLPNAAIQTQGGNSFVEIVKAPDEIKQKLEIGKSIKLPKGVTIENQRIETGISNDSLTEIVSGLKEGDIVVLSKISNTKTKNTAVNQTQFRIQMPGMTSPRGR